MYRMIAGLSASLLVAGGTPALAQSAADQKEEVVCQLLDNCNDAAPAATEAAPTARGGGRSSATRGFSLARPKAEAATTSPAAAAPVANRQAKPAAVKAKSPVTKAGTYDLRVTFASGSFDLAPAAKSRATVFASALQDPRLAGKRVRIEGHTDSIGNADKNRALSEQRAHAVADFLIGAGVEKSRLDVAGFGPSQPLPGIPTTAAAQRRVVAVLIK